MTTAHDAHNLSRLERGRDLADGEIDCFLADHQTAIRHATADTGTEIAAQLRDRIRSQPAPAPNDAAALAAALEDARTALALADSTARSKEQTDGRYEQVVMRGFAALRELAALPAHSPAPPEPDPCCRCDHAYGICAHHDFCARRAAPPAPLPLDVERHRRSPQQDYDPTPSCLLCFKAWDETGNILPEYRCPESPAALATPEPTEDGG